MPGLTTVSVRKGRLGVPMKYFVQFCVSHTCFEQINNSVFDKTESKVDQEKKQLDQTHTCIILHSDPITSLNFIGELRNHCMKFLCVLISKLMKHKIKLKLKM